jgi:proteic killer suppression protein
VRALPPQMLPRLRLILADLDLAQSPEALNLPEYHLHQLSGKMKGFWSVRVTGNYRLIFRLEAGETWDVDLVDYH